MRDYENLGIWQKSIELTKEIYKETLLISKLDFHPLPAIIQESIIVIPSNIAYGYTQNTKEEVSQLILNSIGSLNAVETNIIIARNLNALTKERAQSIINDIDELRKMIHLFLKTLFNK